MKILIVDDHPGYREGLRGWLEGCGSDTEVVEADSVEEAVSCGARESFELVTLDMVLPGVSGTSAIAAMREAFPRARIIVISSQLSPQLVEATIDAGALGYVPKTATSAVLRHALGLILNNKVYLPAEILRARASTGIDDEAEQLEQQFSRLTERQHAVLMLLMRGAPNKRIASELDIGEATVKTHVAAVFRALNVRNRTEAVYAAAKREASRSTMRVNNL